VIEYQKARLPAPFRHGEVTIDSLEFAVGQKRREATVVHVLGVCNGTVPFAGCILISEGQDVPHDLRTFDVPLDLAELAAAIDLALASSPVASEEIRRICE
jgi:hypothetical protein